MLHDVDSHQTHWQLKSTMHTLWLDTLFKYYPEASLIMSHRHLNKVFPSVCCFFLAYNSIYFNENNLHSLKIMIQQMITLLHSWLQRTREFRSQQLSSKNILDIQYEDLMKDPISTLCRIYTNILTSYIMV